MRAPKLLTTGVAVVALAFAGALGVQQPASAYSGTTGKGCAANLYRSGARSECVRYIQQMLNGTLQCSGGYTIAADSIFGRNTDANVRKFQSAHRLTADGIVGKNTWDKLCAMAGQVSYAYSSSGAAKNLAWGSAFNAGCYIELPASGSYPSYHTV